MMANIYESELLYKLMERDGLNIPSSIPPYESEIKAYLIEQVKLAYPKLTDYEAEWLFYNYTKHLPADFPVETITNVTNATVNNVVPYAYKSAILSGLTLVNLATLNSVTYSGNTTIAKRYILNETYFKQNTDYLLLYKSNIETTNVGFQTYDSGNSFVSLITSSLQKEGIVKFNSGNAIGVRINSNNDFSETITISDIMLIEYQEGIENWDIPFFEGMQSVKMPVLTTTGKNLFNIEKLEGLNANIEMIPNGIRIENSQCDITRCFTTPFKENTQYTVSFKHTQIEGEGREGFRFYYTDGTESFIIPASNSSWVGSTLPNKTIKSVSLSFNYTGTSELTHIQLEEGTVATTTYEPFKTNILSTSEDVVLRGVGDVQDELNCLTGEVTERIGEIVLDGSENWKEHTSGRYCLSNVLNNVKRPNNKNINFKCDKINPITYEDEYNGATGISIYNKGNYDFIVRTDIKTIEEFKEWLLNNQTTVQYQLATESIKTVDLSITDENGNKIKTFIPIEETMHIQTNGTPIKPVVSMEIPVEAITQNLASFIVGE